MSSIAGLCWRWAPVVIYMAAIFFVSADSSPPAPSSISDKWLHLFAYALLGLLVCRALAGGLPRRVTKRTAVTTLIVSIAYGVSDELHQTFVPGRSPELLDVAADAAGVSLGLIGCWAWGIIRTPDSQLPTSNPSP